MSETTRNNKPFEAEQNALSKLRQLNRSMRRGRPYGRPHEGKGLSPCGKGDRRHGGRGRDQEAQGERGHRHHGGGRFLYLLQQADGQTTGELAEGLGIRPASATEALDRLEERGLIRREKDSADARKTRVFLTQESAEHLEAFKQCRQQENDWLNSVLTDQEQQTFIALCDKLLAAYNANSSELN